MNIGYWLVYIFTAIGMIIPLVAIVLLYFREQDKTTMCLMVTNVGALVMNAGYMLLLQSRTYFEAMALYKIMFVGNPLFYLFFIRFVSSFYKSLKISKLLNLVFIIITILDLCTVGAVWMNSENGYRDIEYRLRNGNSSTVISEETTEEQTEDTEATEETDSPSGENLPGAPENSPENRKMFSNRANGYVYMRVKGGVIYNVRYMVLSAVLFLLILGDIIAFVRIKDKQGKHKIAYVFVALILVLGSTLVTLFANLTYDLVPLFSSVTVLVLILGVVKGNILDVSALGKLWSLKQYEDIFVIVDNKYRLIECNNHAKEAFTELRDAVPGKAIGGEIKRIIEEDINEYEWDDKKYVCRSSPIDINDKMVGHSLLLMDMTDEVKLRERLREEKQKAIDANEAKTNFMSSISHEIRTPMNAIVGMTEILLRRKQDEYNTEYLNNIKNSGNALLSLINDILDFSKIESGKFEIVDDEYEPMSMFNDLSMIFLNRIGEKPLELLFDIDPALPRKLYGDAGRIRQVLVNIVNNAIKYTDEGIVMLSVRCEMRPDGKLNIICRVSDTGTGIREEDIDKLFDAFSQVDLKKNKNKEGTGLGLSIAKQLVEAMGGTISVESEYGKGSTFTFNFVQGVVNKEPAAEIHGNKKVSAGGLMSSKENTHVLKKLCKDFDLEYLSRNDILEGRKIPEFLFVENKLLNGEGKEAEELGVLVGNLNKTDCEVIILYDPMVETVASSDYTLLNKPLYSLNFAQAINHEVLSFESKQEFILNFKAPKAKVLVVDDNEMNRKVALGLMAPLQMQIDTANDGKQAVEKIMKNDYDIVFMDHMMPVMDGIEATKAIRGLEEEKYKKLPIVALTANAVSSARESFNEAGMNGFLAKPINTKDLCKTIKKLLPEEFIEAAEEIREEEVLEEDLPVIEGLDVKAGVENSGGLKLFTSLLADFYKLIDIKTTKIEKCLADGDIRDYTIEVHALKNTARMIGALELSDMFHTLEDAGNAEDMETIEKDTGKTLKLYNSYKQVLKPYAESENKNKENADDEEIEEVLLAIKEAMESFDLDSADAALKRLEEIRMPEGLSEHAEKLSALVADVAMEDVISLCDNMISILKEGKNVERSKEYTDNSGPGRVHNGVDKKQVRGKGL